MDQVVIPQLDWRVIFNRAAPAHMRGWGRVRAAQIDEMRRMLHLGAAAQAVTALLLVHLLSGSVSGVALAAWLIAVATLLILTAVQHDRLRGAMPHSLPARAIEEAALHGVAFGLVWAVPAFAFYPALPMADGMAICLATAAVMAAAAFVFSSVPPMAAAFVTVLGLGATSMLNSAGSAGSGAIGVAYTGGLLFMIFVNGRAFMERRMADLALADRSETISLLLRESEHSEADWLWETNRLLQLQHVSPRFARALGMDAARLEQRPIRELLRRGRLPAGDAIETCLARRLPFSDLLMAIEVDGAERWLELSARPRLDAAGRFTGYRGVGADVTQRELSARRIAHLARHDPLTGMPNRRQLMETLGDALADGRSCALLLIDLDRFKTVNDTLGHSAGDHLLRQVGDRFGPLLGPDMIAGRLGGDEFAVVVRAGLTDEALDGLARELIDALQPAFEHEDQRLFVGASIGIAVGPSDGARAQELVRSADLALYRAKAEGGNLACRYQPVLHARAEARRQIELALRAALGAREFAIVYQPVVDAATGRVAGFEALLRWTNARLGQVAPSDFVPLAEETGLIRDIGEWTLRNACAEAAAWGGSAFVAVNVSPRQLADPGFLGIVRSALSQSGLAPHRLELEITESLFLQMTADTRRVLDGIHALGVRLAIDDFGTGYSSLGYLRDSAFDTIKIDRSFVAGARAEDIASQAIIRAVAVLASSLGMTIVAEGVETPEQLGLLRSIGCGRIQGFLFSQPVAATEVAGLVGRTIHVASAEPACLPTRPRLMGRAGGGV